MVSLGYLGKRRAKFRDTILIVKIHKDGSVLEIEDRTCQNYNVLVDYFKVKFCKVLWSKIIQEANGLSRKKLTSGRSEMDRKDSFN